MKLVYIASPYTIGSPVRNVRRQLRLANRLMDAGFCPVVPLFSHYQHEMYPRPYEDWMQIDLAKLSRCDILYRLSGKSQGADREVGFAMVHAIPVVYTWRELMWHGA